MFPDQLGLKEYSSSFHLISRKAFNNYGGVERTFKNNCSEAEGL